MYKHEEIWNESWKTIKKSYYRDNKDLFFQKIVNNSDGIKFYSEYQTFVNRENIISNAQTIFFEDEKVDTTFINYNYSYDSKGKKKSLEVFSINDSIKSIQFVFFNENEKPIISYQIVDNDTIEKREMKYLHGKIVELTYESKIKPSIEVYQYDINENVKSIKLYNIEDLSLKDSLEYIYMNDTKGNTEKIFIKDFEKDTITILKLITVENSEF